MSLTFRIKEHAHAIGFDLVGVAPAESVPHGHAYTDWLAQGFAGEMAYLTRHVEKRQSVEAVLPGVRSVIVVAMNYHASETDAPPDGGPAGIIARYARGTDYHDVMTRKLEALLACIRTEAGVPVQGKVYVDTGPVLERDLASLAGLGWFGKHTNLIHKRLGSWFLLGEILVDLVLDYDQPVTDHCGTCTRCLEACPTQAILQPYVLDARRCISYLTIELKGGIPEEFRPLMGNRIFGCDDCQDVCPWNRRAPVTNEPELLPRDGTAHPALLDLLLLSSEQFRLRFKGSPIKRAKRRGLLRNVAVALGNSGDRRAIPALIDALNDPEPLVRGHAAWALGRLGGEQARMALERALETEADPDVRTELEHALAMIQAPQNSVLH